MLRTSPTAPRDVAITFYDGFTDIMTPSFLAVLSGFVGVEFVVHLRALQNDRRVYVLRII
jgi:hypothetical protein